MRTCTDLMRFTLPGHNGFLLYLRQYIRRHRRRSRCGLLMPEGICTLHAIWVDTDACANDARSKYRDKSCYDKAQ